MNSVFIRPPKVAGASIENTLGIKQYNHLDHVTTNFHQEGLASFGHMDYALLVKDGYVTPDFDATAYKFAFVRNPYDRAVSWYFFANARGRVPSTMTFLGFVREFLSKPMEPIGLYNGINRSQYNPQIRWTENVNLDYLGRYETLHTDIAVLAEVLGVDAPDPPIVHYSDHGPYATYYCDESKEIVGKAHKEDFDQFSYSSTLLH